MDMSLPWSLEGDGLQAEQFVEVPTGFMVIVDSCQQTAACPDCGEQSQRIHSHYLRRLADLPWSGQSVAISLRVRRFYCLRADCRRRLFTERLPGVVAPYARRTNRLQVCLVALGQHTGGEVGSRLASLLGIPVSADTLLRQLKRSALPPASTPRILGVDDFAFRRGHCYGTILVDLERHCPVDLLPDREAKTLADWLRAHPGVEIIARDRAGAYAEGARQGAPGAMQVADRWHLLKNLREAIERLLARHHCDLKAVSHALIPTSPPPSRPTTPPAPAPTSVSSVSRRARLREARRQHRRERYEQVLAWHQQGKSVSFIAHELRMCRGTVRRHLRAGQFRERTPRTVPPGKLAPFHAFLRSRWEAGCHSAAALWRELKAQGFSGSPILVRRAVQPWRTELAAAQAPEDTAHIQVPSPSRASWWLLALAPESDAQTQAAHQRFVKALVEHCPDLATAQTLAMPFVDMIRHHQADQFDHWLTQIHHSDVPELQGFARGVLNDKAAVIAGLTSPWSSGQVEGQVNRLKCLKREMYGRASFPLLKARVLHPP